MRTCPGACAPSSTTRTPRDSSSRTRSCAGSSIPLTLVIWLTSAIRVLGVTAPSTASSTELGVGSGNGSSATTTDRPAFWAIWRALLTHALYS
ncbi:MAG: hypothetical protein ACFCBV_05695 [Phycisphaerales bacterium]